MSCHFPDLAQSFDATRPHTLLTENPLRAGSLVYRLDDTGETVCVPNIWYNQTYTVRVGVLRFDARRERERADTLQKRSAYGYTPAMVADVVGRLRRRADQIDAEADRLLAAGDPSRPVLASGMELDLGGAVGV